MNNVVEFKREIEDILDDWFKYKSNKVLCIHGARRVGKTTSIKRFCNNNFKSVIYIDLAYNHKIHEELNKMLNSYKPEVSSLINFILNELGDSNIKDIKDEEIVIIIDEIQLNPIIYSMLKIISEESNLRLIATGSYMSVLKKYNYQNREEDFLNPDFNNNARLGDSIVYYRMRSLTFNEFFSGIEGKTLKTYLKERVNNNFCLGNYLDMDFTYIREIYNMYMICGGYPYIASEYIRNKNRYNKEELLDILFINTGDLLNTIVAESLVYLNTKLSILNPDTLNEIFEEIIKIILFNIITHNDDSNKVGVNFDSIFEISYTFNKESIYKRFNGKYSDKIIQNCVSWFIHFGLLEVITSKEINEERFIISDLAVFNYYINKMEINEGNSLGSKIKHFIYLECIKNVERGYRYNVDKVGVKSFSMKAHFGASEKHELDLIISDRFNNPFKELNIYGIEVKSTGGDCKSLGYYMEKNIINTPVITNVSNMISYQCVDNKKVIVLPVYLLMELLTLVEY